MEMPNAFTYFPSEELRKYCDFYLILEGFNYEKTLNLSPLGYSGLIIQFAPQSLKLNGNSQPQYFLFGQVTTPISIELSPSSKILVVAFKPTGLHNLFGCNMDQITNKTLDLQKVSSIDFNNYSKRLSDLTNNQKIDLAETLLLKFSEEINQQYRTQIFDLIVEDIISFKGNISVTKLSIKYSVSRRFIERAFKQKVGVNAKRFTKIIKFNFLISEIKKSSKVCWLDLTEHCGYFDQSHLIKDFLELAGISPAKYISENRIKNDLIFKTDIKNIFSKY